MNGPLLSLVVGTRGRTWQLERLLDSLARQSHTGFEIVVVDQNPDARLAPVITAGRWPFAIRHLHSSGNVGLSLARNLGWRASRGDVLVFPDDDSWYPGDFLTRGIALLNGTNADLLTGRSADESGRSINGRFASLAGPITRSSVWHMQQEWVTFVRRPLMERLGGYDEDVGTGGPTPWQASEGPDLILRALALEAVCRYDPSLVGHHEELSMVPTDDAGLAKTLGYARGKGYVLRKHHSSPLTLVWWLARPLYSLVRALLLGNLHKVRYHWLHITGRWQGWRDGSKMHRQALIAGSEP